MALGLTTPGGRLRIHRRRSAAQGGYEIKMGVARGLRVSTDDEATVHVSATPRRLCSSTKTCKDVGGATLT
jgi:hypothetical protein